MKEVTIFCDGSCQGNPGKGGWGVILIYGKHRREISGGTNNVTTSNRMELMAVFQGLSALKEPCHVTIYTDSRNVIGWLGGDWKRKNIGIRTLCEQIDRVVRAKSLKVSYRKVAAHTGNPMNERADQLATAAIPKAVSSDYYSCGNCRQPWPCDCGDSVRICDICGGDQYTCQCDERSYIKTGLSTIPK